MKIEKFFMYLFLLSTCTVTLFPKEGTQSNEKMIVKKQQPQYADEPMMSQPDCSALSSQEQDFAAQLSDANQMLFCSKMTASQRQKAMQMSGMQGTSTSGINMSPNDAVQNVMQNNAGQTTPKRQKGSGACPVQ